MIKILTCPFIGLYFILFPIYSRSQNIQGDKKDSITYKLDQINSRLDKLNEKSVRAGVSVAYRKISSHYSSSYQSASISPIDSTLQLENMDKSAFILSTSIVVSPFTKANWIQNLMKDNGESLKSAYLSNKHLKENKYRNISDSGLKKRNMLGLIVKQGILYFIQNIGITANLNLIELSQAQKDLTFNKSLEGGIGFCLRISQNIYFSYANELIFSKQLRETIKKLANHKVYFNGQAVSSIDQLDQSNNNYFITKNIIGHSFRVIITF